MELHSHIRAKRVWNYLRVIYFMMRKGLISKRKLLMDLNLAMKRRNKVLSRSFTSILHGHAHSKRDLAFGIREYEFSCSNSPAVFSRKRRHNYFPCLGSIFEEPDMWRPHAVALRRIEYSPSPSPSPKISLFPSGELAPGENRSLTPSPISIKVIDYSEEEDDEEFKGQENIIDNEAEEFIRRFYEQLQAQNRIALLEYHASKYQNLMAA